MACCVDTDEHFTRSRRRRRHVCQLQLLSSDDSQSLHLIAESQRDVMWRVQLTLGMLSGRLVMQW